MGRTEGFKVSHFFNTKGFGACFGQRQTIAVGYKINVFVGALQKNIAHNAAYSIHLYTHACSYFANGGVKGFLYVFS